jgi:outer membrane receptor for ferrienterochelin and colicin
LTLSNPNLATIYGGELEIRKSINNNFTIYSNLSYFKSEVNVQGRTRQLQGQSPYIINTGLFYTKGKYSVNMFYNRIGERISAVGFQGYPDIYENARDVIDMTVQYQTKKMSIKLGVSDLLGQYSKFYQNNQSRTLIKTNNEQTINLTINYKL